MVCAVRLLALGSLIGFATACGAGPMSSAGEQIDKMSSQIDAAKKCSVEKATKPYVIRWEAAERGVLESRLHRGGMVLVRYSGCKLEVIRNCSAPKMSYDYHGLSPKEDEQRIKSVDELYTNIPMGAGALEATLKSKGELRIGTMMVGRYEADVNDVKVRDLDGPACNKVTHAIQAVTVGAFELFAGAGTEAGGGVKAFGAGLGGKTSEERSSLSRDGDIKKCEKASVKDDAPPDRCGALIRLELLAVKGEGGQPVYKVGRVCPAGKHFVEGEGCVISSGAGGDASDRFEADGKKVLDTKTGLVWERRPKGRTMHWEQAKAHCLALKIDGEGGWRLPRKKELKSLVKKSQRGARIDATAFPKTAASKYWTLSPDREMPGDAWTIDFHSGKQISVGTGSRRHVRCVRAN